MASTRVLLVDDDEILRSTMSAVLQAQDFDVTSASNVSEALKLISSSTFDVLLSDLHMPGAGDGLTVVSAMRHSNPRAITMLLSAFPEMGAAAQAILLQADQIMVKPMDMSALVEAIKQRLKIGSPTTNKVETVASIVERSVDETISDWYRGVEKQDALTWVPMTFENRTSHLPKLFRDLVLRLRSHKELGTREITSSAAIEHGLVRRKQGYTADMMVEESRMLQVSIFRMLQNNLATIDFSVVLLGVMTIADEIDSQLSQSMRSYLSTTSVEALPVGRSL